jgi:two-component system chemotaxis response regulator CheY
MAVSLMTATSRSVLVVDDDDAIREALAELLLDEGFAVHLAKNGREALDWLQQTAEPPGVILLDLMMPVMDGRTMLRIRETDPAVRRIPLLVFTAERSSPDLADDQYIDGILTKPIIVEDLLAAVDRCTSDAPDQSVSASGA